MRCTARQPVAPYNPSCGPAVSVENSKIPLITIQIIGQAGRFGQCQKPRLIKMFGKGRHPVAGGVSLQVFQNADHPVVLHVALHLSAKSCDNMIDKGLTKAGHKNKKGPPLQAIPPNTPLRC